LIERAVGSHALSVDDLSSVLFVLVLGDPLRLEGGQGGEGGSSSPDAVVSILGGDDLDHVLLGAHGVELFLKSVGKTFVEGGTSREDHVGVEVLSDVDITLLDGLEAHGVHTWSLISFLDEAWVEESLWSHESWAVDHHGLTIGKLVVHLELTGLGGLGLIGGWVEGNEAALLLDTSDDLGPSGLSSRLGDTVGGQKIHEMGGDGSTGDVVLLDGVGDGETFVDGDGMGHTISRVGHHTGGSTIGVEGEHGLDRHVQTLDLESLEHEGGHLLSVGLGVHGGFGKHDLVLGWVDSQLVGEAVLPDLLHLVPRGDDT